MSDPTYDLLVIGGGINGAGIARDAAGRGLSVLLVEQDDLAAHTSSASSKLIHGGLRYLEQYEFRLVAEALAEREVLLKIAAHLVRPARFVMPHVPQLRPRWMIRTGLFLYDHLGRRTRLPGSHAVRLDRPPYSSGLKPEFRHGFIYSDCRVDDARLVVANARDAAARGAKVLTRTECLQAKRDGAVWRLRLRGREGEWEVAARAVVNAAGPWVKSVLNERLRQPSADNVRLVRGSHVVVPRLYEGEHAFILQNDDRRVVFMIPYGDDHTLIGTTDIPHDGDPSRPEASATEVEYLCRAASRYLERAVHPAHVVWQYAGVRPLYDDGTVNPSAVTRDYVLRLDIDQGAAPVLSVFGGKITTYRRLAEHALEKLGPWFRRLGMGPSWTADAALPGATIPRGDRVSFEQHLAQRYPRLPRPLLHALAGRHGALTYDLLGNAATAADLGESFGAELCTREIDYLVEHEWAMNAEDVLWRRTKAGLHMTPAQQEAVTRYLGSRVSGTV
ncbi:MAG TPA: glycerol-3-phosphate dehydrogenase [Burkholderiales bacterium]|nr:glycerol-3-phosphate dehydrogenase [Burkholderiales bacterium]